MANARASRFHRVRQTCRICASRRLDDVVDLGTSPLANAFLRRDQLAAREPDAPLRVVRCLRCGLVQLRDVVDPEKLFRDYVYFSSASGSMPDHFAELARSAATRFGGKTPGLMVEIGSNDGVLLRNFIGTSHSVLGVEPARNIARQANDNGIRTWNEFFTRALASRIRRELGPARIIFSNNVLAHIDDVHETAAGVAELLEPEGAWIIEVPHLAEMIRHVEFDTVYHEHLSYFSLPPLQRLFAAHGLVLTHVDALRVHGGSLRLTVRPRGAHARPDASVGRTLGRERTAGLHRAETYRRFRARVERVRTELPRLIRKLRAGGQRVVGYGAPAKGNTLLNYCGLTPADLDYVLDTTPAKQGLFTPGSRIPVRPPTAFYDDPPDYALLLAWNFQAYVLEKEQFFLRRGGRFIRPIPSPAVVPRPLKPSPTHAPSLRDSPRESSPAPRKRFSAAPGARLPA